MPTKKTVHARVTYRTAGDDGINVKRVALESASRDGGTLRLKFAEPLSVDDEVHVLSVTVYF